ncbi:MULTISPECIES: hypothetical protein [Halorussus]|uniref:hypothetical protein n=1 Tax=Halorussus TaxID=1070314 RepID=UPI000E211546|nr:MULTISPECIES: hypothetical protein [Halorussus]NHN60261.1 hypothetical protein [Halorussus sp. JP-T4]
MSVPAGVDADRGPPMVVPLAHFLAGFGFLLAGAALGVLDALGRAPGMARLAHLHLLLVGWVCLTILGAMTQFVPVWSGVDLHSRRLAAAQLALVAGGVAGFAGLLLAGRLDWLPVAGAAMLAGFWAFVYNVGRTLWSAALPDDTDETDGAPRLAGIALDPTERHFALALGFVVPVTALGLLLALDFVRPTLAPAGLARPRVVAAHATLAVFGIVLTTVLGALYQLATMFTQTELGDRDATLQRVEELAYPAGVLALAAGRLVGGEWLARLGAAGVLVGLLAFAAVLARKLAETRVERTPMLSRYWVVALALPAWALAAAPAWVADPTDPAATFGHPAAGHLLAAGVVGFVLLGTLYHVVPFIVWVRQYSDRVGLEPVPMIDDLYDDRLAAVDFRLALGGIGLLVAGEVWGSGFARLVGGVAATLGFGVFAVNLAGVVVRHGPESLRVDALSAAPPASGDGDPDDRVP